MNDNDINQVERTIQQAHEVLYNRNTPLGKRPKGGEAGVNYNAWHGSNDARQDDTWTQPEDESHPSDDSAQETKGLE